MKSIIRLIAPTGYSTRNVILFVALTTYSVPLSVSERHGSEIKQLTVAIWMVIQRLVTRGAQGTKSPLEKFCPTGKMYWTWFWAHLLSENSPPLLVPQARYGPGQKAKLLSFFGWEVDIVWWLIAANAAFKNLNSHSSRMWLKCSSIVINILRHITEEHDESTVEN